MIKKMKFLFFLFLLLSSKVIAFSSETEVKKYYDIRKIQKNFPTSHVRRQKTPYDAVTIENGFQGYTIMLAHFNTPMQAKSFFYQTIQDAAKQNLTMFFSEEGYTTLLDFQRGIVYGILTEEENCISVRFTSIEAISEILPIVDKNIDTWKII
ncbi:hypothetical protein EGX98_04125 [Fusobacterium necrophorum]|uniref:hypothetical protein n=1 Tax=Fusobacterium necrophorum TaxID=859 RepID=UPI00055E63DD|nr:hypothetical protein [Fusobacterium necrophorum]AYZ73298.1 hypothetical protein EGX98_04125 [Fusobacterium necrophorum]AZW08703.1 hypothetical protein EO219_03290 [Fusobacterium necrophorum subsp. necrophorum]SDB22197.1 hypothetical protein SAMN02983009_01065 [Fusobacterium necrophorum]SQD09648.1 Uncharacterised protein [Fusobacterium necrophorum subsp. necrophorum]